MNVKNEIKSIIVRSGMTMQHVVDLLSEEYGWSDSISNFSNKLTRGSLRYREAIQIADVMGYDLIWQKRRDSRCRNLSMPSCAFCGAQRQLVRWPAAAERR